MASPESSFQDSAADVIAVLVLIIVPAIAIGVFWLVHILPEKIAEKRHHPQKEAIKVLCLLSLVFGGLLWPIAWLWAYSKPVLHKLAYGRDKHDDYFLELERERNAELGVEQPAETAVATSAVAATGDPRTNATWPTAVRAEIDSLRHEMSALAQRGSTSMPELQRLQQRLDAMERAVGEHELMEARH